MPIAELDSVKSDLQNRVRLDFEVTSVLTNGFAELDPGLMARSGWAIVDDSRSLVFNSDGWLTAALTPGDVVTHTLTGRRHGILIGLPAGHRASDRDVRGHLRIGGAEVCGDLGQRSVDERAVAALSQRGKWSGDA